MTKSELIEILELIDNIDFMISDFQLALSELNEKITEFMEEDLPND